MTSTKGCSWASRPHKACVDSLCLHITWDDDFEWIFQKLWFFRQWDKNLVLKFWCPWGKVNGREDCDQINVKPDDYDEVDEDYYAPNTYDEDVADVDADADDVDDDDLGPGCPH